MKEKYPWKFGKDERERERDEQSMTLKFQALGIRVSEP
jgi:hypothetical protein